MLLGVIPMICFRFLEKIRKRENWKIRVHRAPTPHRREPTPHRRPTSQRGMPRRCEAEGPKWNPSGMPRCS